MLPRNPERTAACRRARALLMICGAGIGVAALFGCTGTTPNPQPVPIEPPSGESTTPSSAETSSSTSAPEPAAAVPLSSLKVGLKRVASGFDAPLLITHAGDGSRRLFVVEQTGRIWVVVDGKPAAKPFLDVSARITTGGERGLLGLAFAPDYKSSGVFYVNYTDARGDTAVVRYKAGDPSSNSPALTGRKVVLAVDQPYANHNGGCLVFEPGTKRMWVGMGDGGAGGDPHRNAQNPKALLGKMLVLDFAKGATPKPQIVQRGVRNPWRFSFDRSTHDLWIGDVGQNAWEEIDVVSLDQAQGVNWGWNLWEGTHPYPAEASPTKKGYRFPVLEYGHDSGFSVTGGFVYRGADFPAMQGTYFYGDFESGWIGALRREAASGSSNSAPESSVVLPDPGIMPSSFGEDERGELYVCDYSGGRIFQIVSK